MTERKWVVCLSYNPICRSKTGFSLSHFDFGKNLGPIRPTSKSPAGFDVLAGKRCVEISLRKIFCTTKVVCVGFRVWTNRSGSFRPWHTQNTNVVSFEDEVLQIRYQSVYHSFRPLIGNVRPHRAVHGEREIPGFFSPCPPRSSRHVRCYVSADSSRTHLLVDDRAWVNTQKLYSGVQRSLRERRVYGGYLGFKKRWKTWYGCDKFR